MDYFWRYYSTILSICEKNDVTIPFEIQFDTHLVMCVCGVVEEKVPIKRYIGSFTKK